MSTLRIDTIDLEFQGAPRVIAAFLLHGPDGPVLIETGPASTLPVLLARLGQRGLKPSDVRDVLVTHIHLDHAGAAGWWAQHGATVRVHPAGAPHLIDPSKLLRSATRIYGDRMDTLWGEVLPAPADRVVAIEDGTVIEAGGLRITAVDTPGHARHHHAYHVGDVAFTGDAAGILLPGNDWIDLPAPPPEFDLEAWKRSLARLRGLGAGTFYRTHFAAGADAAAELDRFEKILDTASGWMRAALDRGLDREAMIDRFTAWMRDRAMAAGTREEDARAYELANPRAMSVDGLVRYWRARLGGVA